MADEREIRATSDRTFAMLDRVRELESTKGHRPLGSPEFVELAREVERVSRLLFRWSGFQVQLAAESAAAVARGEMPRDPLVAIQPRALDRVLTLWREAQIRLEIAPPGSPEAAAAADDIERYRDEYHATADQKMAEDREGV